MRNYFSFYLKGFFMGIADLIPGVSGGTVAFLCGIYEKLIETISLFNKDFFLKCIQLKIKDAFQEIDWRFLVSLLMGILTAIFSLARLIDFLLVYYHTYTFSFFCGLIGASIFIIIKNLETKINLTFAISGGLIAYGIASLVPLQTSNNLLIIFFSGFISIIAMILPGISGSFLLLILGKYEYIIRVLKNPFIDDSWMVLLAFSLGAGFGLLSFSRFLNYLIKNHYIKLISFLIGILIGSMKKLWPWKEIVDSIVVNGKVRVLGERNIFPVELNKEFIFVFFY